MTPNRMEAATGVDGARRSAWSAIQAFLLSETLVSVCYWSTVALVAVAGACVLYWRWTRSAPVLTLPDDPWVLRHRLGLSKSRFRYCWSATWRRRAGRRFRGIGSGDT